MPLEPAADVRLVMVTRLLPYGARYPGAGRGLYS